MTKHYLKLAIAGNLFTLTAYAQQSEIRQMRRSVSTLSQEITQLSQQTIKITRQNALDARSIRGVYLLLEAKTPVRLKSQIGTLRMLAGSITPDGDGSRLTLRIQSESDDLLPAFVATVASGQITDIIHGYQEANVQDQLISASASIPTPSNMDIPLRLNVTPDRVGFIRVHDIQSTTAQ